jgi:hypothetical protein
MTISLLGTRGNVRRWLMVVLVLFALGIGCRREPVRPTDPEATRREVENLNKARQKEWGGK